MCSVSMIAQDWSQREWPRVQPFFLGNQLPTREEFDALKADLESIKKLLIAAKQYDKETGQPDCEDAKKVALFRQLAQLLDVDISAVFPAEAH